VVASAFTLGLFYSHSTTTWAIGQLSWERLITTEGLRIVKFTFETRHW